MIRVLQCVNNMHRAGLETMLMNYYRHIDRTQIQFDFLTHRPEKSDYDDEIEALGGRVYHAPRLYPQNYPAYFAYMKRFFADHPEYKIVHSHIDSMSFFPLLAAKMAGVPVRIAHSHNTSIDLDFKYILKQLFRLQINSAANVRCACGKEAGEFLFRGREFQVIPNAMDGEVFRYDESIRDRVRTELDLNGKFVAGHVGRFAYAKNHGFLIDIFCEIAAREENAVLMLIGTGEKMDEIKAYARQKGVGEKVLFLGSRSDVSELYQAMDVFIMPSLFEGVPLTGLEAQFASLPCIFSDRVPQEVQFSEHCSFIPLQKGAAYWAGQALAVRKISRQASVARSVDFDIRSAAKRLEKYYLNLSDSLD